MLAFEGTAGFYNFQGVTACGQVHNNGEKIAAISSGLFGIEAVRSILIQDFTQCGKHIIINRGTKSIEAVIVDECASCGNLYDLKLSPSAFSYLGDQPEGTIPVSWGNK